MDQHPIPQDVTGFQFKLIGTMTVKQFGYVATGVIMAVVLFYLPIHSVFGVLLKVILIPLFGSSGVVIAFVPIDGRPIDVMTTNFVKAVFSPNQYIYHRQGKQLSFTTITTTKAPVAKKTEQKTQEASRQTPSTLLDRKEEKLRALLLTSRGQVKNDIDKKEAAFLQTLTLPTTTPQTAAVISPQQKVAPPIVHQQTVAPIAKLPQAQPQAFQQAPVMPQTPLVITSPLPPQAVQKPSLPQQSVPTTPANPNDLSKKELDLEKQLSQAKQEELVSKTPVVEQQKVALLSQQIQEVHTKKQQLEQELSQLQNQLASQKGITPPVPSAPPPQEQQHVRVIPQGVTKKAGLPHVSDSPNVVVGIVKDPRGNILPRILVEVKDKDGNPVRAFKTNQLGQFASATPLSPGTYTIELEDPKKQQQFDIVQITANNQILPPIEIISHDAREELRKQLFAN